jgi:ketol-acid reductoisomerase
MNNIISDTAEYGCYLFNNDARPLLKEFFSNINSDTIGTGVLSKSNNAVDDERLNIINENIKKHSIEKIGSELRQHMTAMKKNN